MDKITTTVTILDRKYRLNSSPEETGSLMNAAEMIDSQARAYGKLYGYKDQQDLLAMVALTQITRMSKKQEEVCSLNPNILAKLEAIDNLLDKALMH